MTLTEKQEKEIKRQILEQTKHFPEERRKQIEEQLEKMTSEQLEAYVKQMMTRQQTAQSQSSTEKGVFRMIISGEMSSKELDQNKDAIAVLDIKPISLGHSIIIPKKQITDAKDLPSSTFSLAKRISKKISSKLKTSGCEIQTEFKFGEIIINIIPIYDKALNVNSPRQDVKEEELEKIYNRLKKEKKPEVIKIRKKKSSKIIKLKREIGRIP